MLMLRKRIRPELEYVGFRARYQQEQGTQEG